MPVTEPRGGPKRQVRVAKAVADGEAGVRHRSDTSSSRAPRPRGTAAVAAAGTVEPPRVGPCCDATRKRPPPALRACACASPSAAPGGNRPRPGSHPPGGTRRCAGSDGADADSRARAPPRPPGALHRHSRSVPRGGRRGSLLGRAARVLAVAPRPPRCWPRAAGG
eukprot:5407570-Pleurochrysis_carterae.AAC.1